jgi:uncharacterized protein YchJ
VPVGKIPPQSFTASCKGITRVLRTPVHISQAFHPGHTNNPPQAKKYDAIWDTGATGSVITKQVVNDCGLKPISMTRVQTAAGIHLSPIYLINMLLPNNVGLFNMRVTEGILSSADVLVGMDVICRGDFAVTCKDGNTTFSFRLPSQECIDFVKESNAKIQPIKAVAKVGRNDPCPCGSGKKYKKCCGK